MTAYMKNDKMDKVLVEGNGESIYFAIDDNTFDLIGMNKVLCSSMKIQFLDGEMNDISFYQAPEGKFIPPHEIEEPETRLKDFNWQIARKPSLIDVLGKYAFTINGFPIKKEKTKLPDPTKIEIEENK
jgi:hypothetical protein